MHRPLDPNTGRPLELDDESKKEQGKGTHSPNVKTKDDSKAKSAPKTTKKEK